MRENPMSIELEPLSENNLGALLEAAVADADPSEVMPPVAGEPGWTAQRKQAFLEFHRGRALRAEGPVELTYVITVDGRAVGAARLEYQGDSFEAGVWIGRSHRGRGVGRAVAERLRIAAVAAGVRRIVAVTTGDNTAARRLLPTATPVDEDGTVRAAVDLE
ncbi:GNAT family N-acetyltransferase [Nocardia fusca]|uniref:GNAT family N-acetyltransferase n=1 Tax=Nocardia fusca TaxID=941183 RepID=UPI001E5524F9|nr:GNAT family N-acetyltransferase [Nocardia fusca]